MSRPRTPRLGPWPSPAPGGLASPGPAPREPVRSTGTVARHRAAAPGDDTAVAPAEAMIIGLAASYLGYRKPDSFRRARTRHPIPGEGKTDDGRPCWTPGAPAGRANGKSPVTGRTAGKPD